MICYYLDGDDSFMGVQTYIVYIKYVKTFAYQLYLNKVA